jgi:CRP-like cAMP-binding protein
VVHPKDGADGKYFRFDPAAMAAAAGGRRNWQGTYSCYMLRTGRKAKVTFTHGPLGKAMSKSLSRQHSRAPEPKKLAVLTKYARKGLADVARRGRKFIRFGTSREEIVTGGVENVADDNNADNGEEVVDDDVDDGKEVVDEDADTSEDADEDDQQLVSVLGIGRFEFGAQPGDWRIGDIILLKRNVIDKHALGHKDGYEENPKTDEWFRINFPDPVKPDEQDEVVIPDV